jgi:hypothetical protein
LRFSPDGELMVAQGIVFDYVTCAESSSLLPDNHERLVAAVKSRTYTPLDPNSLSNTLPRLAALAMAYESNPYQNEQGRRDAFSRSLVGNGSMFRQTYPEGYFENFKVFSNKPEALKSPEYPMLFDRYMSQAFATCLERTFIITRKGYFGIAAPGTRKDDLVCVLRGGNAPFILRSENRNLYNLLGDAYVHGIMSGEAVQGAKTGDITEFRIR